ncbi:iron uptake system protein EfeO [Cryobacterium tepidiphilum]|uniref:PbrT family lead (Pb2+) uptake porter n=1 Tax=Cryobacterium tepidiphilum TaxID=2486026 RepID=A0A3M8LFY5_9MICO|nr:iron uptake system protein EfeO [Cryobacterium tepidiphilum]RNE63829.1 PbrT family lead (Pb2+) uptake porter [Cryobacterium tepidiphilum]
MPARLPLLAAAAVTLLGLTGCAADDGPSGDTPALTVESSATECTVSADEAPAGTIRFTVHNAGDQVTEFYLLGDDKLRIVGEVENIGPGLSRDLVVQLQAGTYYTTCKPGMQGDGVGTAPFTVTPSTAAAPDLSADTAAQVESANTAYAAYVTEEVEQLVEGTARFAAAYTAGDDEAARDLYAPTRIHWERIETVAESFGDLDPRLDAREADLAEGEAWTGWHAIEKDLWAGNAGADFERYSADQRAELARQLVADTATLQGKAEGLSFTLAQQANGAIGLLDEVAGSKISGEEEFWSHTDLSDFQGNIDGARVLYQGLREIVVAKEPALAEQLDAEFAAVQALLEAQRAGDGFTPYTGLTPAEVKAFSDQVNALGEPLNRLTSVVVG